MIPADVSLLGSDPWWLVLLKALFAFVLLLVLTLWVIVFERQLVGRMQHRHGPIYNGPFGALQSLADGMKLMFKEDLTPKGADKLIYNLAPFIIAVPAITAFSVIPFAGRVPLPWGGETNLQVADTPVSVLFILAIAAIGAYGIVLAGWSSGSTYPLLGGLRSTAQIISYEIAMGLALVAVFLQSGAMSTSQIVEAQGTPVKLFFGPEVPIWYCLSLFPSFVIYLVSMVGETNRAPFDMPEAEGELVAGFATEYSSMKYAMFFMAEYMNMITVSSLATTMFLGGYKAPLPFNLIPGLDQGWWGLLWFFLKTAFLLSIFVWLRGTLPRVRYDQLMGLGWKVLIPISLAWLVLVAGLRLLVREGLSPLPIILVGLVLGLVVAVVFVQGLRADEAAEAREKLRRPSRRFSAFAGGYPVPPLEGQELPESARVVRASAATQTRSGVDTLTDDEGPEDDVDEDLDDDSDSATTKESDS
ncbi:MAG TPA: NADH-quinone oxidoreductase subunit NuoH [Candidatus Avipropionibacterium avicola]|uniref:NADH-quinone oxidoreductase subunit H n=1 Tax=Candidatus Avipropionibacterium avicola TaxID=2840701 RepID=A0A9D1GV26_9ACTN|nr:NADH-quinone oxidoreductase subunit NuoH [Candidatus Avipropionibacterium avicola]